MDPSDPIRQTHKGRGPGFKEQVRAVYNDWDRLEVVNGESLVVPSGPSPEFRPLPPEDEIARTIVELRDRRQTIENLEAALR